MRTPLWSVTLPRELPPISFFIVMAVGLFASIQAAIRGVRGDGWLLAAVILPAYVLLFYLVRSFVRLVDGREKRPGTGSDRASRRVRGTSSEA